MDQENQENQENGLATRKKPGKLTMTRKTDYDQEIYGNILKNYALYAIFVLLK